MAREIRVQLIGDEKDLARAFKAASGHADTFSKHMKSVDDDAGKVFRGVAAGSGAFTSLGRSVAFASSAFLGTAGLTMVMKDSVAAASDLHEEVNKTDVVFGKSADAVSRWSETSAKAMGLARAEALKSASSFGAMLEPLGVAPAKAATMSMSLVKLASDMASFNNQSPEEMLQKLQAGLAGMPRPLREFGVQLSQSRIAAEALSEGLVKADVDMGKVSIATRAVDIAQAKLMETQKKFPANSTQVAQAQNQLEAAQGRLNKTMAGHIPILNAEQKTLASYGIIMKDTKIQQGDFERTSGGLANQQRILAANVKNTEEVIGGALMPAVLKITKGINDWLGKSENQEKVQRAVNTAVDKGTKFVEAAWPVVQTLAREAGHVAEKAKAVVDALGGWENAFKIIGGAMVLGKVLKLTDAFGGLAGVGGKSGIGAAMLGVDGLQAKLGRLAKIGVITIGIELALNPPKWAERYSGSKGWANLWHDITAKLPFAGGGTTSSGGVGPAFGFGTTPGIGSVSGGLIQSAAQGSAISPAQLRELIRRESGGDPLARSSAGAFGTTQFMPGTAFGYKVRAGSSASAVQSQVVGAVKYLDDLSKQFHGHLTLALAAYNWGAANVERLVKQYGTDWYKHAPSGVRDYAFGIAGMQTAAAAQGAFRTTVAPGANRAGTTINKSLLSFANRVANVAGENLTVGTGTSHSTNVAGTNRQSAHWQGNAIDIPAYGAELVRLGQDALIAAGMPEAKARSSKGGLFNFNGYQIIFNTDGPGIGDHTDHLHIGLLGKQAVTLPDAKGATTIGGGTGAGVGLAGGAAPKVPLHTVHPTTPGTAPLIPVAMANALRYAQVMTPGTADDLRELQREQKYLLAQMKRASKGTQRYGDILDALGSIKGDIASIVKNVRTAATGSGLGAILGLVGAQPTRTTGARLGAALGLSGAVPNTTAAGTGAMLGLLGNTHIGSTVGLQDANMLPIAGGFGAPSPQIIKQLQANAAKVAAAAVRAHKQDYANAWTEFSDYAMTLFDRTTQAHLKTMSSDFQKQMNTFNRETSAHIKTMSNDFQAQMSAFTRETQQHLTALQKAAAQLTTSEQALANMDAQARQQQLRDALEQAQASGDPKQIADANLAIQRDALEKQATIERQAVNDALERDSQAYQDQRDAQAQALQDTFDAQQQAYQDQRDAQAQSLQDIYDGQVQSYQDQRDLDKIAYTETLKALGEHLLNRQATIQDANDVITAIMAADGSAAGNAYVNAMRAALAAAGLALAGVPGGATYTRPGPAPLAFAAAAAGRTDIGGRVNVLGSQGDRILKFAAGGDFMVRGPQLIMVGEAGPERVQVTPHGGSHGDLHTTLVVQLDGREVYRTVQTEALRDLARNGTTGIR